MSASILIPGMGGNIDAKPVSKSRSPAIGAESASGLEGWMAELSSALNRPAASTANAQREQESTVLSHDLDGASGRAGKHAGEHAGEHAAHHHATGLHTHDPHGAQVLHASNAPHSVAVNAQTASLQSHGAAVHPHLPAGHHGIATTAGALAGVAAETHHALTHPHAPGSSGVAGAVNGAHPEHAGALLAVANATGVATATPVLSASLQANLQSLDANGNPLPASPAQALADMLRSAQAAGDIRDATLRVVGGFSAAGQEALDASLSTRRKLMDALQEMGGTGVTSGLSGDAALVAAGLLEDASLASGFQVFAADGLAAGMAAEALTERPVAAAGDLAGFFSLTERAPGTVDGLQGADMATSVNADLDWMAVLEQQAGLSRLRETDSLRLDLQLQDSQRVALEASLQDGVLTVKLGARADGSFWVPPEQLEALKASLRMSTSEVQEVVFEQSADLGHSDAQQGSQSAADSRGGDKRERLSSDSGNDERHQQDGSIRADAQARGRRGVGEDEPGLAGDVARGRLSESVAGRGGISLRA